MKKAPISKQIRLRMDAILALAKSDDVFRKRLIKKPEETLNAFGIAKQDALAFAKKWGFGPSADCGSDTCRATAPCGWTICGKTTNNCSEIPKRGDDRVNPPQRVTRRRKTAE